MTLLGVNIDHVATLRQARDKAYPSPLEAALIAESAGADLITLHLREDRRHIQDDDVFMLRHALKTRMNLEMALTQEMLSHALKIAPQDVCLVPENRQERTTEGGLDVVGQFWLIEDFTKELKDAGIRVALFVNPDMESLQAAVDVGAQVVELHTGRYADANSREEAATELERIRKAARRAHELGLEVHAGHGLTLHNVETIAAIAEISELNIGHSIISHAIFVGLAQAVRDMKTRIDQARILNR